MQKRVRALAYIVITIILVGCARRAFTLTEDAAIDRLMSTKWVANLKRAIPNRRLICMVDDYDTRDAIYLYLGDDEGDHTTRIGFYRVTSDGRVWVNQDVTDLDECWAVIE